ncbi:MAG: hypothetical protein IT244_06605 [Bacteroidia bacterium]|nr:hypothetical protein [Bacteroidia bacterium]
MKIKTPWYFQTGSIVGFASIAAATVAGFWYFSKDATPAQQTPVGSHVPAFVQNQAKMEVVNTDKQVPEKTLQVLFNHPQTETKYYPSESGAIDFSAANIKSSDMPLLAEFPSPEFVSKTALLPWELQYPFDTIIIKASASPIQINVGNGSVLTIPAGAFTTQSGAPVVGEYMVLFRHFTDAADMIAAGLFMKSGESALLNNGAFELHFKQQGEDIFIQKGKPLLFTFLTLSNSTAFAGYHSKNIKYSWNSMIQDGFVTGISEKDNRRTVTDSFVEKRNFWQWIGDVFTGKKAEWNTYERVDLGSEVGEFDKNKYRTFEIAEAGLFASSAASNAGSGKSKAIKLLSKNNDELGTVVYQVFINNNLVIKHEADYMGNVNLQYSASDRCILVVPVANSRYLAVLDANGFDRIVKADGNNTAVLQTYGSEINSIAALRKLIDSYSNQRPMRH